MRYVQGMKMAPIVIAVSATALLLTGCSSSPEARVNEACVKSAVAQLPDGTTQIDASEITTVNASEVGRMADGNPLDADPNDPVEYLTIGSIWYEYGGKQKSKAVSCRTIMKKGEPTKPIEAEVTN